MFVGVWRGLEDRRDQGVMWKVVFFVGFVMFFWGFLVLRVVWSVWWVGSKLRRQLSGFFGVVVYFLLREYRYFWNLEGLQFGLGQGEGLGSFWKWFKEFLWGECY